MTACSPAWTRPTTASTAGTTPPTPGTFDVSGDGTHTVEYWSVDTVGNTESTNSEDLHIDDTAPVTTDDAEPSYVSSATVTLSPSDALPVSPPHTGD